MRPSLQTPCTASWKAMTPADNGRHCSTCCKTVTDFSQMTNAEIVDFLAQQNEEGCGRFKPHQLEPHGNRWHQFIIRLQQQLDGSDKGPKTSRLMISLLSLVLFISGCRTKYLGGYTHNHYTVRYLDSIRDRDIPATMHQLAPVTDDEKLIQKLRKQEQGIKPLEKDSL